MNYYRSSLDTLIVPDKLLEGSLRTSIMEYFVETLVDLLMVRDGDREVELEVVDLDS